MPSESDGALLRPIGIEVDAASQVCRLDAPEGRRAVREPFDEVAHVPFRIVGELLGETRERACRRIGRHGLEAAFADNRTPLKWCRRSGVVDRERDSVIPIGDRRFSSVTSGAPQLVVEPHVAQRYDVTLVFRAERNADDPLLFQQGDEFVRVK